MTGSMREETIEVCEARIFSECLSTETSLFEQKIEAVFVAPDPFENTKPLLGSIFG